MLWIFVRDFCYGKTTSSLQPSRAFLILLLTMAQANHVPMQQSWYGGEEVELGRDSDLVVSSEWD